MRRVFAIAVASLLLAVAALPRAASAAAEDYGGWKLECLRAGESPARQECRIYQSAAVKHKTVLSVSVVLLRVRDKTGGGSKPVPVMRAVTVLGVNIPLGVVMKIDDLPQAQLAYQTCTSGGCVAQLAPASELAARARTGKKFYVAYQLADAAKPAVFDLSLDGFGAALDALAQKSASPAGAK